MQCQNNIADTQLIAAIKQSDYVSYNILFQRYYAQLCRYVNSMLSNINDVEDIVQDIFLSVWDNRKKINIQENIAGYLYTMAKNRTLNHIRKEASYRIALEEYEKKMLEYIEENAFESFEFKSALIDCINRLPDRNKEILLLHRVKSLKQKEISEKLNISIQTIKNHIWISLQKLRTCLEKKGMHLF